MNPDARREIEILRVDEQRLARDINSISPKVSLHAKLREEHAVIQKRIRELAGNNALPPAEGIITRNQEKRVKQARKILHKRILKEGRSQTSDFAAA